VKHATIKDIANHLSLSVSTVSRALTGDKNVREETRKNILKTAKELGYSPNPVATNLKYGHTNTIGVIVPEMNTMYTIQVIRGIQSVLYENGIKVIVADSNEDPDRERENLQMMEHFMVDGIIISQSSYLKNKDEYLRLQNEEMPMVFYGRIPHGLNVSQVLIDDYAKSFFVVEKMILSGRHKICHILGPKDVYNSTQRGRGYRDAMSKYGLPHGDDMQVYGGLDLDGGSNAVDQLIRRGVDFDGIFAFTDLLAIGAMHRLQELGKKIPEDISISGFSGSMMSTVVNPQLTTVEPPMFAMGQTAANLIMEKIKNPSSDARTVILNAEIMMRGSTGYYPK